MSSPGKASWLFLLTIGMLLLSACGNTTSGTGTTTQTVTTQPQPQSGDIPDTQAFVSYHSPKGEYSLEVPEGWAQSVTEKSTIFTDKLNIVQVDIILTQSAPTLESVRAHEAVTLQKTGSNVQNLKVQSTQLSQTTVILMSYSADSTANAVTGKQSRLENNRYLFFHNGKLALLTLSAPVGADNVDQWARIAGSFKWV